MEILQSGQMLGPYRILNKIGQGGMATVYKAYQPSMDRNVAIKVLPQQLAETVEFATRFQQEARIIARLEHPHILPVFDYGESDGINYFVMRYLEAGTLKARMEAGPLSLPEIDRLFTQLAGALGYAHSHGVIHRDLKPANALVDDQGNLFLTDFGIAKLLESASPRLTQTDAIMGTPAYISPEQAKALTVNQRSDIYSLGIILFEMVTGRVPFVADTPLAVILKHISDPLPLPSVVKAGIPDPIERIILKALAKNPEDRYGTTADFLAAWKHALAETQTARHTTPQATTPPVRTTSPESQKSQPAPKAATSGLLAGCFVIACIVLIAGGAVIFGTGWLSSRTSPATEVFVTETFAPAQPTATILPPTAENRPTEIIPPAGDILIEDNFSDDSLWGTLTDLDNNIAYDKETLRMQVFKANWFVWSTLNGESYDNVHMEVTVINNDGENTTAFGFLCHQQESQNEYYYLVVTAGGEYVIAMTVNGSSDEFLTNGGEWARSSLIKRAADSYRLGADCGNGVISLYIDGKLVDSVEDETYTSGSVGLVTWSGENANSADVTFDDYLLTTLP